jgi:tetratricopeptide (TPR) repeat protein
MATIAELFQSAIRLHQSGNLAEAEALYRQVLQADPAHAEAYHFLGLMALQAGHHVAALDLIRRALALNPLNANAHYNLGNILSGEGQFAQAAEYFQQALRLNPRHADAHNNLGLIFAQCGQMTEAGNCFQQALSINPLHANALNNLGNVFKEQDRFTQAIECFERVLAINPSHADAYANLGNALIGIGRDADAAECYRQALAIDPGHKRALWNRCILRLQQGDLAAAWPDFDYRWTVPGIVARTFEEPRWDGSSFQGKKILVYAEQGLGDSIQFQRFLPMVKERGGTLFFECPPALFRLFTGIRGVDELIPAGKPLPGFDVQIPLMSLPGIFGTTLATIPAEVHDLKADRQRVLHWQNELRQVARRHEPRAARRKPAGCPLHIGIAWQSDPKHPGFHLKSFPLTCLQALARLENVHLVSLQVGPGIKHIAHVCFPVTDLGSRFDPNSLDDLAGALMNMDLVVTVDTAVAHLSGALGLPTWVALPYVACWRWLLNRSDSPWYPTLRLFRQSRVGDWDEVFQHMATEVRSFKPSA